MLGFHDLQLDEVSWLVDCFENVHSLAVREGEHCVMKMGLCKRRMGHCMKRMEHCMKMMGHYMKKMGHCMRRMEHCMMV